MNDEWLARPPEGGCTVSSLSTVRPGITRDVIRQGHTKSRKLVLEVLRVLVTPVGPPARAPGCACAPLLLAALPSGLLGLRRPLLLAITAARSHSLDDGDLNCTTM